MKCSNSGKMVCALFTGAIIGGALGILFAPDKGDETRRRIAEKSGDLTDSMKTKLNDFLKEVKDEVDTIRKQIVSFGKSKSAEA